VFPFLPLILPILSAATTYLQQRISMVDNNEPTQKAMLYFMPVMMAYITYTVPGGLGLYWVVFNLLGILQQLYVNRIHLNQKLDTGTGIEVDAPQRLLEEEKNEPVARRDKGGKEKNAGPNNRKKGKKR
jgi:YidC/Oxa1 family membrane protein insertase